MKITHLIITFCLLTPLAVSAENYNIRKIDASQASLDRLSKQKISIPSHMSAKDKTRVRTVVEKIGKEDMKGAERVWASLVKTLPESSRAVDISTLMMFVIRESYQEQLEDLNFYSNKVKHFNKVKSQLRDNITEARKWKSELERQWKDKNKQGKRPVSKKATIVKFDGNIPKFVPGKDPKLRVKRAKMNKDEIDKYLEQLEQKLATVGDDAQLANIDLQNNMKKAQDILQLMSNVSKMLHDTSMSIVRKIG